VIATHNQLCFVHFSADSVHNILVIRLSSLGDVLLATPLVRVLRRHYPDACIDVAVAGTYVELWANNPYVNNIIAIDKSRAVTSLPASLRALGKHKGSYDLAIDLQRSLRSLLLRGAVAKQSLLYEKHRAEKLALVRKKQNPPVITQVVDRYFNAVEAIEVLNDDDGLELWFLEEKASGQYLSAKRTALAAKTSRRFVIAPGARHATKRWLPERFAELCDQLKRNYEAEVVLVGGMEDRDLCHAIQSQCTESIIDASGSTSFIETARIIDTADVVVSNDSGVMHIAAARRVPVVAIFGSTVPAFGFAPYGTPNIVVEKDVPCRPCTHIGREHCPLGHFDCMKEIQTTDVLTAVEEMVVSC
jgi:heptosyltransferase-2